VQWRAGGYHGFFRVENSFIGILQIQRHTIAGNIDLDHVVVVRFRRILIAKQNPMIRRRRSPWVTSSSESPASRRSGLQGPEVPGPLVSDDGITYDNGVRVPTG
jgi:hypothetical protein